VFEWYDFYLYATLAPFFAELFFPGGNAAAALLMLFVMMVYAAMVYGPVAATGDIYYGLWYPIAVAAMTLAIGTLFLRETLGTKIH